MIPRSAQPAEKTFTRLESIFATPDFYKRHEEHPQLQADLNATKKKMAKLDVR